MIRVGIVGLGKVGRIRAVELAKIPNVSLAGYFDPFVPEETNFFEKRFSSAEALIKSGDIDAVMISTPNNLTASLVADSLSSGKHVFAEKPPARNLLEFAKIADARDRALDKTLMFGFNHRHKSSVRKVAQIIASGELGDLRWIRCRYGKEPVPQGDEGRNWRDVPEVAGGGILLDQGIHGLDLILKFMGMPTEVQAIISAEKETNPLMETNAFLQLRNRDTSVSASLHSTSLQWRYIFSLELSLSRGSIVLNGLKTPSGSYGEEKLTVHTLHDSGTRKTDEFPSLHDDSWETETWNFIDCVVNGQQPLDGSFDDAKTIVEVLEKAYASDTTWTRPTLE